MASQRMYFPIVLFSVILLYHVSAVKVPLTQPYFNYVPVPAVTPSPIRINTKDVQTIYRLPRFTFDVKNKTGTMQNTGKEIFITPSSSRGSFTIGSVMGLDRYNLHGIRFIWNSSLGPAADIVDGIGTPLEVNIIFQNSNYSSFQEALLHRDGIAICSTRIIVGNQDNDNFSPFIPYLNQVIPQGSSVSVPEGVVASWIILHFRLAYFAYPGSYRDFNTGKQYYCATMLVNRLANPHSPAISLKQSSFMLLQDSSGRPYDNAVQAVDSPDTPVVKSGPAFLILSSQ